MDIILKYFPDLTETQKQQFAQLKDLYAEWNAQINVISRKDIDALYERHVLHSLGIAKVMPFKKGSRILDVGTGGGFPGIPLAILFPDCKFHLVDSIGKKIKVVQAVAEGIGLKNLKAEHARAEDIPGTFDFIVSRAVSKMPEFVNWVERKRAKKDINIFPNGILYLKGGDLREELATFKAAEEHLLSDFFTEEFFETKKVVYLPL